jgi:hypothetical protein
VNFSQASLFRRQNVSGFFLILSRLRAVTHNTCITSSVRTISHWPPYPIPRPYRYRYSVCDLFPCELHSATKAAASCNSVLVFDLKLYFGLRTAVLPGSLSVAVVKALWFYLQASSLSAAATLCECFVFLSFIGFGYLNVFFCDK